jgi:hypothetical protein
MRKVSEEAMESSQLVATLKAQYERATVDRKKFDPAFHYVRYVLPLPEETQDPIELKISQGYEIDEKLTAGKNVYLRIPKAEHEKILDRYATMSSLRQQAMRKKKAVGYSDDFESQFEVEELASREIEPALDLD